MENRIAWITQLIGGAGRRNWVVDSKVLALREVIGGAGMRHLVIGLKRLFLI